MYQKYIVLTLFFLIAPITSVEPVLDYAAIARQADKLHAEELHRNFVYDSSMVLSGATVVCYLAYQLYRWNQPISYGPLTFSQEVQKNAHVFNQVCEVYLKNQESRWYSTPVWVVKVLGSIALQSLVAQAVQPLYMKIKNYSDGLVTVPIKRYWFLVEQLPHFNVTHTVDIPHHIFDFIVHSEAIAGAYTDHKYDLFKQSAEYILAHMRYVSSNKVSYDYQRYVLEKISYTLEDIFEEMLRDINENRYNNKKIDIFKNLLRDLFHEIDAYSL